VPPRLKQPPPGEEIRLRSLQIIKRKVVALQSPAPLKAADVIAAVFNPTEVGILKRLAAGERVAGIDLSQERAKKELAWIAHGGEYIDGVTY